MPIAMITGGASGLGLAAAQRLARDGYTVAVIDLNPDEATSVAAQLGEGHVGIGLDVTDEAAAETAFDQVENRLGPVAVLVTFAGIYSGGPQPGHVGIADMELDAWNRVLAVNITGTFLFVREMVRRRTAKPVSDTRIITISSMGGQMGGTSGGSAYASSKGAVLGLTKAVAREVAPLQITVNCIAPGPIDTPLVRRTVADPTPMCSMIPLGRFGQPEEIAAAVAFLVSSDASFVTGATIDVNGGILMR